MDWTVVQRTTYSNCEALRVERADGSPARTFLLPFDRPVHVDSRRITVVSPGAWFHRFKTLVLSQYPYGGLRKYPSTLEVIPYQLEPALAMLRDGHPRLLVADDVGLGKTIEAGVVLRELAERSHEFRGLVLVPAGLREQWIGELSRHFNCDAIVADASWLRISSRCLPPDVNPWSPPGVYLASFDFIKRPEALRPLEDVQWDLVVVDEAHAAAAGTDRRAAVDAVALRSHRVLLLTATPPADPEQFSALSRIGAGTSDPGIGMFQRRRSPAGSCQVRRSVMLPLRLTEEERRMHRLLERYTMLVWREARSRGDTQSRLTTMVLRKRALSSAGSLEVSVRRRRELLAEKPGDAVVQLLLPIVDADEESREDVVADVLLASSGLADSAGEQRWLAGVLTAAETAARRESKARVLVRLLARAGEPAIVFTEFRDTLEALRHRLLAAGLPSCALHGGLSAAERRAVLSDFARGGTTLLATDAAAEGLNLQKTCRLIVHYELPWNPARMLQRAGRVDRIGQHRRVHEIALVASDTCESLVLAPLMRRATGWLTAGGTGRMLELLTESRVAEAVFEGFRPDVPVTSPNIPRLVIDLSADGLAEAARLQRQRALMAGVPSARVESTRSAIHVTVITRSSLPAGVLLLFELKTATAAGEVLERALVAIHVAFDPIRWPRRPALIKARINEILSLSLAAVSATLADLTRLHVERVRPLFVQARARVRHRERAIAQRRDSAARQLVQAGLFDRRPAHRVQRSNIDPTGQPCPADFDTKEEPASLIGSADLAGVLVLADR